MYVSILYLLFINNLLRRGIGSPQYSFLVMGWVGCKSLAFHKILMFCLYNNLSIILIRAEGIIMSDDKKNELQEARAEVKLSKVRSLPTKEELENTERYEQIKYASGRVFYVERRKFNEAGSSPVFKAYEFLADGQMALLVAKQHYKAFVDGDDGRASITLPEIRAIFEVGEQPDKEPVVEVKSSPSGGANPASPAAQGSLPAKAQPVGIEKPVSAVEAKSSAVVLSHKYTDIIRKGKEIQIEQAISRLAYSDSAEPIRPYYSIVKNAEIEAVLPGDVVARCIVFEKLVPGVDLTKPRAREIIGGYDALTRVRQINKIVACVKSLHDKGIIHGDLNEGNILVDDEGNFRLIDFDKSALIPAELLKELLIPYRRVTGLAKHYAAPERAKNSIGKCTDIFMLAATILLFSNVNNPYKTRFTAAKIAKDRRDAHKDITEFLKNYQVSKQVSQCLEEAKDIANRSMKFLERNLYRLPFDIEGAAELPAFLGTNLQELHVKFIKKIMKPIPEERPSIEDVQKFYIALEECLVLIKETPDLQENEKTQAIKQILNSLAQDKAEIKSAKSVALRADEEMALACVVDILRNGKHKPQLQHDKLMFPYNQLSTIFQTQKIPENFDNQLFIQMLKVLLADDDYIKEHGKEYRKYQSTDEIFNTDQAKLAAARYGFMKFLFNSIILPKGEVGFLSPEQTQEFMNLYNIQRALYKERYCKVEKDEQKVKAVSSVGGKAPGAVKVFKSPSAMFAPSAPKELSPVEKFVKRCLIPYEFPGDNKNSPAKLKKEQELISEWRFMMAKEPPSISLEGRCVQLARNNLLIEAGRSAPNSKNVGKAIAILEYYTSPETPESCRREALDLLMKIDKNETPFQKIAQAAKIKKEGLEISKGEPQKPAQDNSAADFVVLPEEGSDGLLLDMA